MRLHAHEEGNIYKDRSIDSGRGAREKHKMRGLYDDPQIADLPFLYSREPR